MKSPKTVQMIDDDLDENPEAWQPISEDALKGFGTSDDSRDNTNWEALDYGQPRGVEWYRQRFGGFGDDILEILAHCDGTNPHKDGDGHNHYDNKELLAEELRKKLTVTFD